MATRTQLQDRLTLEFDDAALATAVVHGLADETIDAVANMCGGDVAASPTLSYRPTTMPGDRVDGVVAFSYGYRLANAVDQHEHDVPPMDALLPGPVNEQLAACIAEFVDHHPVPVVAQWEIAHVLDDLSVPNVVSVAPDVGDDGSTRYLSTAGVLDKGLRLVDSTGTRPHRVGVFAHADHAPRCVATAHAWRLDAALITGVDLPTDYDPEAGQRWTRDRVTWIGTDLFARTRLAASTDWTSFSKVNQ